MRRSWSIKMYFRIVWRPSWNYKCDLVNFRTTGTIKMGVISQKNLKAPVFDGQTSYRTLFETVVLSNKWTQQERAYVLILTLRGSGPGPSIWAGTQKGSKRARTLYKNSLRTSKDWSCSPPWQWVWKIETRLLGMRLCRLSVMQNCSRHWDWENYEGSLGIQSPSCARKIQIKDPLSSSGSDGRISRELSVVENATRLYIWDTTAEN